MKIAITDIETTGFESKGIILEIGIVELDLSNGETKVLYNELVKEPRLTEEHRTSWIFENSDLNFDDIMNAEPLDIETIQKIYDNYKSTAFNKQFDFTFLKARGLIINELQCPMRLATNICKLPGRFGNYKWPSVEEAWKYFFPGIEYVEKHRGADDAVHEAGIVFELYKMGIFKI